MFNRLSVLDALKSVKELLKLVPHTNENGVGVFVGGGISELVYPPKRIARPAYHCGKRFQLDPLLEMLVETRPALGVVVIDGQTAVIARARGADGDEIQVLKKLTVHNHGRCRRGGQSALRFDRIRDQREDSFVVKVAEEMNGLFGPGSGDEDGDEDGGGGGIAGLLVAGPSRVKHQLAESTALAKPLAAKLITKVDVAESGRGGVVEALHRSTDAIAAFLDAPSCNLLRSFFDRIDAFDDKVLYGPGLCLEALECHAIDTLIVHRKVAESTPYVADQPAGAAAAEPTEQTLAEYLRGPAGPSASGAKVVWIEPLSEDSARLAAFGGIGAITRWPFDVQLPMADSDGEGTVDCAADEPAQVLATSTLRAEAASWTPMGAC